MPLKLQCTWGPHQGGDGPSSPTQGESQLEINTGGWVGVGGRGRTINKGNS